MPTTNILNTRNGRFIAFGLMYVSEGIPSGFTGAAMVTFMRQQGLELAQIGAFAATLLLPWSFKWLWAPAVDIIKLPRYGGRKAWILACTLGMTVTLAITASIDFVENFQLLLVMVFITNLFGATQDVAIDSLAVSALKPDERGRGSGYMFGGQALGKALGGGGAIFVSGLWGLEAALLYVVTLLLLNLAFIARYVADPFVEAASTSAKPLAAMASKLKSFAATLFASFFRSGKGPRLGLLLSLVPMGAMVLGYALVGTMAVDYGLTENQIATLNILGVIAVALGCLVGGALGDRLGVKLALACAFVLSTVPSLILAVQIHQLGLTGVSIPVFYSCIISYGLFLGMSFATSAALFMGLTNPAVAATQFTLFMAMNNLTASYTNLWHGLAAQAWNYATVLYIDAGVVLISLTVLYFVVPNTAARPGAPQAA